MATEDSDGKFLLEGSRDTTRVVVSCDMARVVATEGQGKKINFGVKQGCDTGARVV